MKVRFPFPTIGTRHIGRILGIVIGIPAGIGGVLFGFLVGSLVDQFRIARRSGESGNTAESRSGGTAVLDPLSCRILGVAPSVNRSELKRVYRRLATNLHPDTSLALDDHQRAELERAFIRIKDAYDTLNAQLADQERGITQKR